MNALTFWFAALVLLIGLFVFKVSPTRFIAVVVLCLIYATLYVGISMTMGLPRPMAVPDNAVVIAHHLEEGSAIYVWVLEEEPRGYRLPWDVGSAKSLRKADKDAGEEGTIMMRWSGTPEGEWTFHPLPPAEYAPKTP